MKDLLFALAAFATFAAAAPAEIITFDFEGTAGTDLDGLATGSTSVTSGGITLTLTATSSMDGVFNLTGTGGFGVNTAGGGDDTDAFDGQSGTESLTFTISSNVALSDLSLVSLEFDRFTGNTDDAGAITADGNFLGGFAGGIFDDDDLNGSNQLALNESGFSTSTEFVLLHAGTITTEMERGFGLEFITFDATATAIPEPGSFLMLGAGLSMVWWQRRRKAA
ncbi:MAG: PEP-CTERM sorting domain-containing protein [Planctomycetaceae bacterium]|nr:PEP-CTERM sorting domain-containing protein [Planctomycetaceae bacterium]